MRDEHLAPGLRDLPLSRDWADVVFHVLAHVRQAAPLPASLHDPAYVAYCESHLGSASSRALGEDANVLARVLTSHDVLARAQWVAFLFEDTASARRSMRRDLAALGPTEANPVALSALAGIEAIAESLRAAAELEAPYHARLPPLTVARTVMDAALARVHPIAPRLATLGVVHLPALCRRGRVVPPRVYVGVPSARLDVTADQVAVQAAHEATVVEIAETASSLGVSLGERDVEHAALVVMAARAVAVPTREHARWWSGSGLPSVESIRALLGAVTWRVVRHALGSDGP